MKVRTRTLYLLWAVTLVVAAFSQITYTIDVIHLRTGTYAASPFHEASERILAVDGRPVNGTADLAEAVHDKGPGGTLTVTVVRDGHSAEYPVALIPLRNPPSWYYAAVAWLLMPTLAMALGFWVVAARPRDIRAWLMLGILLGMSQLTRNTLLDPMGWGKAAGLPGLVLQTAGVPLWAICMLLFGIYFPQRWTVDRRLPWIKWLLLAGPVFVLVMTVPREIAAAVDQGLMASLPGYPRAGVFLLCLCPAISIFFVGISHKYSDAALGPDDRRRLKLLYWGSTAGLTPLFLMILATTMLRRIPFGGQDGPVYSLALMAVVIFPLTMAYVVLVERALDVRVVIRQGVQYALARRGVRLLQAGVVSGVMVLMFNYVNAPGASRPQRIIPIALGVVVTVRIREAGKWVSGWVDRKFFREAYNAEQILGDLSEQVRGILERDALLDTVARKISESLHVERIAILLREGNVFRPALALGYAAPPVECLPADDGVVEEAKTSRGAIAAAAGRKLPLQAELLLPLPSRKELLGFIGLGPKKSEEPYTPSDARLLQTVAAQTGLALENARLSEAIAAETAQRELLAREIEIAREVQERLFPQTLPEVASLHYAGHCRPARAVGGDYYDFLALSSGRLGLVIGDVSGKGVPAALLMASLQASVRGQSEGAGSVADLMANVNRLVCDASPENRYATFFYGRFDPAARRLVYSNGGHNPPIVIRGAEVLRLEHGGPPVGLFRFSRYQQDEIALEPGDLLLLFTDGISEAENPAEEEWGEDSLIEAARRCDGLPPVEAIARIMREADGFASGAPQHDDMTLVVARVV